MPLIRNLKTDKESVVSKEQWQNMVDTKRSMLFKVINTSEAKSQGKVVIPEKITEFQINRPERIVTVPLDVQVTATITKSKPTKK